MAFLFLHAFTVFSSFPIIIGDILQRTAAVTIDQLVTDGSQFVKRIVHGEKLSHNPGYLLFTAPYKLCDGGCEDDEDNFAMAFPIYVGKKGREKYKELYERDHQSMHSAKSNAPFRTKPTKKLFTLCPSEVTQEQTTATETTISDTTTINTIATVSETDTTGTETPTEDTTLDETQTDNTDVLTTVTETASEIETTVISTTDTTTFTETTETELPTDSETTDTQTTKTEITTETIIKTPIITEKGMRTTKALKLISKTTLAELAIPATETTATADETTIAITESTIETTALPKTENTEVTETEDITFEAYTSAETEEEEEEKEEKETTYVTNAFGIRCPSKICRNKQKPTPSIISLARSKLSDRKPDMRNAGWNSDYSDLQDDSLYF